MKKYFFTIILRLLQKIKITGVFLQKTLFIVFFCSGCLSSHEVMYYTANTQLPGTTTNMKTPGYWISNIENPDRIIMQDKEIDTFNKNIEGSGVYVRNIVNTPPIDTTADLTRTLENNIKYIKSMKLFDTSGDKINKKFLEKTFDNCAIDSVSDKINYCFFIDNSDLRIIPYDGQLTDVRKELFFDALQTSRINISTPAAVVHSSYDNKWVYVVTSNVSGWTKRLNVAYCDKSVFTSIVTRNFFVVTDGKTDIYTDNDHLRYHSYVRMGAKLFAEPGKSNNDANKIFIPLSDTDGNLILGIGYIDKKSVSTGFVPFTQRNMINQAFKLLNSPYGWGGMYGEQDCSQFLCEIFATAGIYLPRNSSNQVLVGKKCEIIKKDLPDMEKMEIIKNEGYPGITFLRFPGHIMLYLGYDENDIYVIHATWGYKEKAGTKEIHRAINRVAVTNLRPGTGSKKGSLINRINKMTVITP